MTRPVLPENELIALLEKHRDGRSLLAIARIVEEAVLRKVRAKPPARFMGMVTRVWQEKFPGSNPPGVAVKVLRPIVDDLGEEETELRLRAYLQQTDAKYVSLPRFVATHAAYAPTNYRKDTTYTDFDAWEGA